MIIPIYASLIALLYLALTARVVRYRRANMISLGEGDDKVLERRIRAHANCGEYAPIGLLLVLMLEMQNGATWYVHLLAMMLVLGRFFHAYALSIPKSSVTIWRVLGMVLTLSSIMFASLVNLFSAL